MPMHEQYDKYKQIAELAAREAGAIQIDGLGKTRTVNYKSAFNIVTDIDKACEAKIIEIIRQEFPADDFLAEESGATEGGGGTRRWIIDPLDGTTNYAHGYPFFAVSIAVEEEGKVIVGMVYNAVSDELFSAQLGGGAYCNNAKIKVSNTDAIEQSLLSTGFPYDTMEANDDNMLRFTTLTDQSHGVRRDGSAALDLCFVACGRSDGFWETGLSPWDTAAGSLIVTEAGGVVTDLTGEEFDLQSGRLLASNGHIHDEVVFVLKRLDAAARQLL
jgi:myo-inositol-1(or 4)-monophosphatase